LRRERSSSFFSPLQVKGPKEIHAILTETLACLLPGRAKDLSAPLYLAVCAHMWSGDAAFPVNNAGHFTAGNVVRAQI